jgi:DNA-binding IclR family transcriptional regulator
LQRHTPHTIVDFGELVTELERTQVRGYAENREEWRLGVCGLGAPIFNARGEPVLAVGISVPSIRFGRAQARSMADKLLTCARDASAGLGFRSPGSVPFVPRTMTRRQR